MLLKFFKRPLPVVLFAVILVGIILWLRSFIGIAPNPYQYLQHQTPIFAYLFGFIRDYHFFNRLIAFSILLLISFYLIQLNSKYILIKNRTYFPALISILLCSSLLPLQGINPALLSSFFLILAIDNIFSAYDIQKPYSNFFMSGVFTAIASVLYIPAAIYILLILFAILLIKPFNLREIIIAFFGFVTPWFFILMFFYLAHDSIGLVKDFIADCWLGDNYPVAYSYISFVFFIFCGLLFLVSIFYLVGSFSTQKISVQKYHNILIWFTLFTAAIYLFVPSASIEMIFFLVIPLSFQISAYFSYTRNRFWPELSLISLIVLSVLMQFFGIS